MDTKLWSESEVDTLRQLSATQSAAQIGKKLGRTKSAVCNKLIKLGLQSYQGWRAHSLPTEAQIRMPERVTAFNYAGSPRYSVRPSIGEIEWCPTCHSPVSNWAEHKERQGHGKPR